MMLATVLSDAIIIGYTSLSYIFSQCRQIKIDSKFLEAQHIMDYSLLLGVHYRAPQHLRSLMFNRSMTAEGLAMLAEEGRCFIKCPLFRIDSPA